MLGIILVDDKQDEGNGGNDGKGHDEVRREPVLVLPLVKDELEGAETDGEERKAPIVDLHLYPLHVRRVLDYDDVHDDREDADGGVDIKDPAPGPVVRDPAAQKRADDGAQHGAHAEDGHGRAVLFPGETFKQDGLADRHEPAAADALDDPEENEALEAPGRAAHERAEREQGDGGDEIILSADI